MGNHQEGEKFSREGRRTEPHHRTPRLFTLAFLKDAPRYIKNAGKQVHGERTIPEAKKKKRFFSSVKRCQCLKLSPAHFNNNNINIKGWLEMPALTES